MKNYQHSVYLDASKCIGCTTCMRHCPTEAIRIKDKKAVINDERCIDCGECIRVCPNKAKKAARSKLDALKDFKWKIALPAPALYGQFENLDDVDIVLNGLLKIGFDDVFEVSAAAELVSAYTRMYLKTEGIASPVISSACPAVLRLIALRFPYLKDHIMQMLPPVEIAAMLAKEKAMKEHPEFKDGDIGICFISPCPAKVTYIKNGFGDYKSRVDVAVSIKDVYIPLLNAMKQTDENQSFSHSGMIGIGWATTGGEASAILNDEYLAADGIDNVNRVLDQIENGNIPKVKFVELNACTGGCVGGVMTIQNPFIARTRLQSLRRYLPVSQNSISKDKEYIPEDYFFDNLPAYNPISRLSDNMAESMRMMADIQKLKEKLPGIDCGSCGAPNCRAFAEDVIKNQSSVDECVLMHKEKFKEFVKTLEKQE